RGQSRALRGLRGGMVDLEHAQSGERVPIGEGVESGAEDHVLPDAARVCLAQFVLRETASRREGGAKERSERRAVEFARIVAQMARHLRIDDGHGQRIVEHHRLVENLMRRPALRHPLRGAARSIILHGRAVYWKPKMPKKRG